MTRTLANDDALRESEQRYRSLFENMNAAFALHDVVLDERGEPADYVFVDVNPAFEDLTGLRREEIIGQTVLHVLPQTEDLWISRYGKVALTGEPVTFTEYSRALGRYYEGCAYCPHPGSFAVTFSDVTERIRAQQEAQSGRAMLARTESVARVGSWERDNLTGEVLWSEGMLRLFGLETEADIPQQAEQFFDLFVVSEPQRAYRDFMDAVANGIPYEVELQIVRQDGEQRYIRAGGYPERDDSGRVVKVHGYCQDITEQHQMLLALRDSKQAAEAASLAKSRFLSNMSHELRTPLNGVLGFTRVLLSDYDRISAREANHLLQFIYDSGLHLLSLIDDVLDLSRVETGNLEINRRLCDLHAMIHTIDLPLRQLCDTNQVELLKTVADDVQCICADETRLRQVLYNLLSNAIKYAGTGGRVELEVRGRGDHAVLVVRDDGPGIPDERKEQIFEPFERLDEHQHIQGTGLGLSIARRIVELHEGTMRVENAPDGGAVFTVELPGLVDRSAEECVKKRQEMHMAEAPRRAGENVLVVEDDYSSLMLMKYVLERNGIMADYATDCRKARQYLNVNRYGMALLDVNLPDGSGVELLQEIRQQMPECVVYALTAHAMQRDRERLLKAGFDAYLAKPIDLDDLVERIRTGG